MRALFRVVAVRFSNLIYAQKYNNNNNNTIIPIIIGATVIVTRSLKENLQAIPGTHPIDFLQKTAVLGTSHILRKVLQCETLNLSGGVHRWFKKHTRKKGPVTSDIK